MVDNAHVYIEEISSIGETDLEVMLADLPVWRAERVNAIKHFQGKKESTVAFLLLQKVLRKRFNITEELLFEYNEHGKPQLTGHPDLHFNMSHCKLAVACVVGFRPVGVDIEMRGRYKEMLAAHVLNEAELSMVKASEDADLEFTKLWTMKEAVLKLVGTGVSSNMKNVLMEYKDKKITTTVCDGYVYSVAE